MKYLLRRTDQGGGYVDEPGSLKAYTRSKEKARRFDTREAAERDRCKENEVIVEVREY